MKVHKPKELKTILHRYGVSFTDDKEVSDLIEKGWIILSSHQLPDPSANVQRVYFTMAKY